MRARFLVFPIVVLTAVGTVGTALTPALAPHHPLLLIALEARDRNLLLARHISLLAFVTVGLVRRLASDPFYYLLGRRYGDGAVRWLEAHGGGSAVRATERAFRRAAYPMLVVFPGAVVCALAGDAEVPPAVFGIVIVIRTVAALIAIRLLGDVFSRPIDDLLHTFDRYLVPATALTVAAVVAWFVWDRRRGTAGDGATADLEPVDDDDGPEGFEPAL